MGQYVDLSSHNGTPDLASYWAAGHRELMLKATEGTEYNWGGMPALANEWHRLGGRVGYYHWLYGTESAQAQYEWFWAHVGPVFRPGDWAMTDFEDVDPSRWVSDRQHRDVVAEFDRLVGQHCVVHDYAPNWYVANMPLCIAYFQTRDITESDYSNSPPLNPHNFRIVAHQFTDRAQVAGMPGPVDYNRWLIPLTSGDDMSAQAEAQISDLHSAVMGRMARIDKLLWAILGDAHNVSARDLLAALLTERPKLVAELKAGGVLADVRTAITEIKQHQDEATSALAAAIAAAPSMDEAKLVDDLSTKLQATLSASVVRALGTALLAPQPSVPVKTS